MLFEEHLKGFKNSLKLRNYSERTIESYFANATQFAAFIGKYYSRITSVSKITKDILLDYQNYLINYRNRTDNPLAGKTQNLKLISVRKFFQYLFKKDLILKDISDVFTFAREEQKITRNILNEKQTLDLLKNIKLNSPISIRNKAIAETFYSSGIRTSELCNLKLHDIDLNNQVITIVKGKGNKSRIVPLTMYAVEYIKLYMEKARKFMLKGKKIDPGYLFLSSRGNRFDKNTINKTVMKSIRKSQNLEKHISCYSFRHMCCTHLLANGVDISHIAQLAGHKSLTTTQKYTRIEISDLKKVHSLCHPREVKR